MERPIMNESNPPAPDDKRTESEREFWARIFRHFTSWSGAEKKASAPDEESDPLEYTLPGAEEVSPEEAETRAGTLIFQELLNDSEIAHMNDNERKNWIKDKLHQIKHEIQKSDYDRIQAIKDADKS
ncbi:MAG: hypothetical protein AAB968_04495, partial [Patescibacteria group bacterium]